MGVKRFSATQFIPERSTWQYHADLHTDDGTPVNPADVLSIVMTLRDLASDTIVNLRNQVEVNNDNGGEVTLGSFDMQFTEDDTAILGTARLERRRMTLDFELSGGGRETHEVYFYIRNFQDVT